MGDRDFDVIIWGASGFTGRLVAEYLQQHYGTNGTLRWAIAGRNEGKLKTIVKQIGNEALPILIADSMDRQSLDQMCQRTKVVCTTVGPYAKYGTELVKACIDAKTDYCDLTGEVQWIRRMIDGHHLEAQQNGVKIVHTCGFDSIPSDLGVYHLQREYHAITGEYCDQIKMRVRAMKGGISGGTYASLANVFAEAVEDKSIFKVLTNPYGLNPEGERQGPDKPDLRKVIYDKDAKSWISPFVMAGINTKVVRRSNALAHYPYGKDFLYDEAVMTGSGFGGRLKGVGAAVGLGVVMGSKPGSVLNKVVNRFMPDPGEGPSKKDRESGFYNLLFFGIKDGELVITTKVTGDRDPGYGSTSKMLGESAVCLALDHQQLPEQYGMLTPATAMGDALLERLTANAGLTFTVK